MRKFTIQTNFNFVFRFSDTLLNFFFINLNACLKKAKTKKFTKSFLLVHIQVKSLSNTKWSKISWHCSFKFFFKWIKLPMLCFLYLSPINLENIWSRGCHYRYYCHHYRSYRLKNNCTVAKLWMTLSPVQSFPPE